MELATAVIYADKAFPFAIEDVHYGGSFSNRCG